MNFKHTLNFSNKENRLCFKSGNQNEIKSLPKTQDTEKLQRQITSGLKYGAGGYITGLSINDETGRKKTYTFSIGRNVRITVDQSQENKNQYIISDNEDANKQIKLDFSKTSKEFGVCSWEEHGQFLSKYDVKIKDQTIIIVKEPIAAMSEKKEHTDKRIRLSEKQAEKLTEKKVWIETRHHFPDGRFESGKKLGTKFTGIVIEPNGTIREGEWENGKLIKLLSEREPTRKDIEKFLQHISETIGIKIELYPNTKEKYNFKTLYVNANLLIKILTHTTLASAGYMRANKISIILHPSAQFWQYTKEGLDMKNNRMFLDHDNHDEDDLVKEINAAVKEHSKQSRAQGKITPPTTSPPVPSAQPQEIKQKKSEKSKCVEFSAEIKAKILSQKDKDKLGIKDAPDSIGPELRKKGKFPSLQQMAKIRQNHEFWDPNNAGVPLIEINELDLEKVVLTCGTKENSVKYLLKEFLRIDPKDIEDAPLGTYFIKKTPEGKKEYYRKITRLGKEIIGKFGKLHQEFENAVNKANPIMNSTVRLFIDENYRSYGENIYTYFKNPPEKRTSLPSYFSIHTSGKALDLQPFVMINGKVIPTFETIKTEKFDENGKEILRFKKTNMEDMLRAAISEEWTKHGGGRGFYTPKRNFHIDARNKRSQWGDW